MIINDLRTTAGSIGKECILRAKADTFDKKMFQYAYHPDRMYYLKFNHIDYDTLQPFSDMDKVILDRLLARDIVGNNARDIVEDHCHMYGDLIKLICNKDLDCGVSATTLNKVFGKNFIPQFKVQLATEVPLEEVSLPILGQLKYNGVRVTALIHDGNITLKTRNGKVFEYPALEEYLRCIPRDVMIDGELTDLENKHHQGVSGIVNSAIKGTPISKELIFNVFDTMELDEFEAQDCCLSYKVRFDRLKEHVNYLYATLEDEVKSLVKLADTYYFNTHADINAKFNEVLGMGLEGLILKREDHKYMFKRSKDWIKMKAIKTADLRCSGIEEGTGKYLNAIGALQCYGEVEGQEVEVNVGSGLSDAQRFYDPAEFIGNLIEVKYNSLIEDKTTGKLSLFLPRFVTVRGDL